MQPPTLKATLLALGLALLTNLKPANAWPSYAGNCNQPGGSHGSSDGQLKPNGYVFKVDGQELAHGETKALTPGSSVPIVMSKTSGKFKGFLITVSGGSNILSSPSNGATKSCSSKGAVNHNNAVDKTSVSTTLSVPSPTTPGTYPYAVSAVAVTEKTKWFKSTFSLSVTVAAADTDCVGSWSACDSACQKTYSITTDQAGSGTSCDAADGDTGSCAPNDSNSDACVPPVDCAGEWSTCDASCSKTYAVTTAKEGSGSDCPSANGATASCSPGDGACPPPVDCVGEWSACDELCQKTYTVTTVQEGTGGACPTSNGVTATCPPGESDSDACESMVGGDADDNGAAKRGARTALASVFAAVAAVAFWCL